MCLGKWSAQAARSARVMAVVSMAGLLALAIATTADILLRYVFASPIRGFVDIASLAGAVLLAGCIPHLLVTRGNISIDFLGDWLGGGRRRALERFSALLTTAYFGVMAWQMVRFSIDMESAGQLIPVLRWPVWFWWAAVAAAICFAGFAGVLTAWSVKKNAS